RKRCTAGFRQPLGDRRRQRRLAMVDVTDRSDVAVRFGTFKLCFGHLTLRSIVDCRQRQSGKLLLDFSRHVRRRFSVVIELHGKGRATLAHRAQVIDVAEHVHERHHRVDEVGIAAHVLTLDLPAPITLLRPFSTPGMNSFGTAPPTTLDSNSNPLPGSFGSTTIETSANWPVPPVCFLCVYLTSARLVMRSRNATCGAPILASTL